jgi:hypothetical protein
MNRDHLNQDKLPPTHALRAYCTQCLGLNRWNREEIENCQGDMAACGPCLFFPYRLGKRPSVRVFRAYCLQCMGGSRSLVADCSVHACPSYPYRFGKNPALVGKRKASEAGQDALRKYHQTDRDDIVFRQDSIFRGHDEAMGIDGEATGLCSGESGRKDKAGRVRGHLSLNQKESGRAIF